MVGKARWEELEAAGHTSLEVRKHREANAGSQLAHSFSFSIGSSLFEQVLPTFKVDLLINTPKSLTDMLTGQPNLDSALLKFTGDFVKLCWLG